MRWLSFFILAYLVLGLHLGLRPYVAWGGVTPNLVLLAVVFVAINAQREPALLGCFVLGAMQDLFTQEPMGVHALAYGLCGMFIVANQGTISREHPATHFMMTLVGGTITAMFVLVHGWLYLKLHPSRLPMAGAAIGRELLGAAYTAALAPVVLGILQRMKRVFAFKQRQATMNLRSRTDRYAQ